MEATQGVFKSNSIFNSNELGSNINFKGFLMETSFIELAYYCTYVFAVYGRPNVFGLETVNNYKFEMFAF